MISLLPNQRLEVVPSSNAPLKYQAITSELLDWTETRERLDTVTGYESVGTLLPRVLAPTVKGGTRTVQSFQIAPVSAATALTLTLQLVTVPATTVGVTTVEVVTTLDVVALAAGQILLMEGGDAGWTVRIPAASTVIPPVGANGQLLTVVGGVATWSDTKTTPFQVALGATPSFTPISVTGSINNYFEQNNQNTSTGTSASSDFVATADNGNATSKFIDMGMNNSGWIGTTWGVANDGYVYVNGGDLWLGTDTAGKVVRINAGGGAAANTVLTVAPTGVTMTGTTTLNTALNGILKATSGVVSGSAAFADLTAKPTTLAGYGITDAALDTAVVHLAGTETVTGQKSFSADTIFRGVGGVPSVAFSSFQTRFDGYRLVNSAVAVDNRCWTLTTSGSTLIHQAVNDAYSTASTYMWVFRTGTTVNSVRFDTSDGLGVNTTPTAGNGLVQLAPGTTKANGVAGGTDSFFYRSAAATWTLENNLILLGQLTAPQLATTATTDSSTGAINALANPTGFIRLTGAAPDVRGIANPGSAARRVVLYFVNAGTLSHLAGTAAAADRITSDTGANIAVAAGKTVELIYDPTSTTWRPIRY